MKKYLMTGIAALALGAGFTSCSHDIEPMTQEEINQIEAQKIVQTYEQAFIKTFGQPAANQNWGFGAANTRGVDADGNHWAASDYGKWKVPPVLKPEQIAAVVEYFQTVQNPRYQDPQWTNYFIQQVYKGGDSPREGYSPEEYTAANGSTKIVGSDHMDHLAAIDPDAEGGEFVDHNNNFNHGDCGVYGNVLAYEEGNPHSANDTQYQYPDKINLMVNSTTKSFGYYNSNSSVRRTEYTGLVSYQTIIDVLGEEKAGCLRDGWNRSFMGFDFEMMIGDGLYQTESNGEPRYVKISDIPGNAPQYIWDGEKVIKWYESSNYDGSQNKMVYTFAEGYDEYIKINGQKIPYLVTNKNMYAGEQLSASTTLTNITQSNLKVYRDYNENTKNVECLNLPLIKAAFEAGYYPTEDKAQTWVKVGGTADGYYSDWIVTLTKAEQYDTDTTNPGGGTTDQTSNADLRIIAEDLTASDENDFDFNDVVFDVYFGDANEAKIVVQAAGGTLPLRIKIGNGEYQEVHAIWDKNTSMMINTYAEKKYPGRGVSDLGPSDPIPLKYAVADAAAARDNITIEVQKTVNNQTQWIELKAEQGKAPAKIAVDPDWQWREERESIKDVSGFTNYVTNGGPWEGMRRQ